MFLATVYCTTIQTISEGLIKFFNFKNSYKGVSPRKIFKQVLLKLLKEFFILDREINNIFSRDSIIPMKTENRPKMQQIKLKKTIYYTQLQLVSYKTD